MELAIDWLEISSVDVTAEMLTEHKKIHKNHETRFLPPK